MTTPLTPSPQIVQLSEHAPLLKDDQFFHVLPNLEVRDEPALWRGVFKLLLENGLTRAEALTRIRFAYTGSLTGELPPGV